MPELRRDPVIGYWTIISTERARRPVEYRAKKTVEDEARCPFCEGHESQTPPEVFAARRPGTSPDGPGWDVRVVSSKVPMLARTSGEAVRGELGLYQVMDGVGLHEVVVESPRHKHDLDELSQAEVEKVLGVYVARLRELAKDERFEYAFLFKNHGHVSGVPKDVIRHSRSQIVAMPIMPKRVKEEMAASDSYYNRRERCVFCDILKQETSEKSRIVAENAEFLSFCPFASRSPFEMRIMPRRHASDFSHLDEKDLPALAAVLKESLLRLRFLLDDPPFNLILHTAPHRTPSKEPRRQALPSYHWYIQIAPRLTTSAGFEWGTGIHINPTPPEDAAMLLKSARVDEGASHASAS